MMSHQQTNYTTAQPSSPVFSSSSFKLHSTTNNHDDPSSLVEEDAKYQQHTSKFRAQQSTRTSTELYHDSYGPQIDTSTWDMIVAQSSIEPTTTASHHHRHKYHSQQATRQKTTTTNVTGEDTANNNQQQQKYNFQYQDEMSRMRERLFRLLSKVPIHVETEPASSIVSPVLLASASHSKQQPIVKSTRPTQCKVIDRKPLIIKYYKDRTLPELIEQHFGCSLIKHNYDRREPLLNEMELALRDSGAGSSLNGAHFGGHKMQTTDCSSCGRAETNQNVPNGLEIKSSPDEQVWSVPVSQQTICSAYGGSNQLVSWHHLSMDDPCGVWKSRNCSGKSTKGPTNQSRHQKQRNGCLGSVCASATKAKSGKIHHSDQARRQSSQLATKTPKRPSAASIAYPEPRSAEIVDGALISTQIYQQQQQQNGGQVTNDFGCSHMKLELDRLDQQPNLPDYYTGQHLVATDNIRQSAFLPLPVVTYGQHNSSIGDTCLEVAHQQMDHFEPAANYHQHQFAPIATINGGSDATAAITQEGARFEQQQPMLMAPNDGQTVANNGAGDWTAEGQLLNDAMQQQQQQYYTDSYYSMGGQFVDQPPHVITAPLDNWPAPNQQLPNDRSVTRLHMIEQQQQQPTSETCGNNNEYICIDALRATPAACGPPLYLPLSASNRSQSELYSPINDQTPSTAQNQYQPPIRLASLCQTAPVAFSHEATNLSHSSSSTGSI